MPATPATPQKRALAPLWVEISLAALGIVCGGALALAWLFFKPVAIVGHMPAAPREFGQVYYVKGSRDKARGARWTQNRRALLEPASRIGGAGVAGGAGGANTITLTEDELNAWWAASSHILRLLRRDATATGRADAVAGATVDTGLVDFRIDRGMLQVAVPVTLRFLSTRADIVVQVRGTFARETGVNELAGAAGLVMFSPGEIYAGSLPLHRIPGAKEFLMRKILADQTLPGLVVAAWQQIDSVRISGKELHITVKTGP